MNLKEMVDLLNNDLSNEYAHWHFYTHAAAVVQGLHRAEYSELFLKHAEGEAKHIFEFQKLILGLNEIPTTEVGVFHLPTGKTYCSPYELLDAACLMEQQVVENYVERLEQAQELQKTSKVDGKYIELFLEDQILDSRGDVDELRLLLTQI